MSAESSENIKTPQMRSLCLGASSPECTSPGYYVERPQTMMERDHVSGEFLEHTESEDRMSLGRRLLDQSGTAYPNKRRLVVTAMSAEPILIEIRPNFQQFIAHSCAGRSTQCDMVHNFVGHETLKDELLTILHRNEELKSREGSPFDQTEAIQDSVFDSEIEKETWPSLCRKAIDSMKFLREDLKRERESREQDALVLASVRGVQAQLEREKEMREHDGRTADARILDLQKQLSQQVVEFTGLESVDKSTEKRICTVQNLTEPQLTGYPHKSGNNAPETPIVHLEAQLSKEREDNQRALVAKEVEIEFLKLKVEELEKDQVVALAGAEECDSLRLKIEEMENEEVQFQRRKASLSTSTGELSGKDLDYGMLKRERDSLLTELEKVHKNYNRTAAKLKENVSKRRRLEAESEGEKQQRSNLAAALYELEGEMEVTVSTIDSLQTSTLESVSALTADLQNFQEKLEKIGVSCKSERRSSEKIDSDKIESVNSIDEQSPSIQNPEVMSTELENIKGFAAAEGVVIQLFSGKQKLDNEISTARTAIKRAIKAYKHRVHHSGIEIRTKMEMVIAERDDLRKRAQVLEEENKGLDDKNSNLTQELSSLRVVKQELTLNVKDLEKDTEKFQEDLLTERAENRKLLKEVKWKCSGKKGGHQESQVIQILEKKLQKQECEYTKMRQEKKALVKEKHRLQYELEKATEKEVKNYGDDIRKLKDDLYNMTQDRNKLRKIKIALAIENVSLKDSLTEMRTKAEALETDCKILRECKVKLEKLEEECDDLQDLKSKAEALEVECKDLRDGKLKTQTLEIECEALRKWKTDVEKLEEGSEYHCKSRESPEDEPGNLLQSSKDEGRHLCENKDCLKEECTKLRELQEKIMKLERDCKQLDEYKIKVKSLETEVKSLSEYKIKATELEGQCENLRRSKFTIADFNSVQDFQEEIVKLKEENENLCQTHQEAIEKQWDVLEADLKAFETKVEELENECESIRRDHLSSMVENSELVREKDRLQRLYSEQKYNLQIMETANECLQKEQERKEEERVKERYDYHASIESLKRNVVELELTFSERLQKQATNYALCLAPKPQMNDRETITLTRQEYEILLAEKAVLLQERDSAHKKLCSVEVNNLHLSANIECLRQEIGREKQETGKQDISAEVLLAQDVINLRSIMSLLEEEAQTSKDEKRKMLMVEDTLRQELRLLKDEKEKLGAALEESERRSSLEHIHSAASSLKDQLAKAIKETDACKEQLTMVIKQKEQLANVANERDNLIFSLNEQITKMANERDDIRRLVEEKMAKLAEDKATVVSKLQKQLAKAAKERDELVHERLILIHECETLNTKLSLLDDERISSSKKFESSDRERVMLQEQCSKIEAELIITTEKLAAEVQAERQKLPLALQDTQKNLKVAMKQKTNTELLANDRVDNVPARAYQLRDEFATPKESLIENLELAKKQTEIIVLERGLLAQEIDLEAGFSLLMEENDALARKSMQEPVKEVRHLKNGKPELATTDKDHLDFEIKKIGQELDILLKNVHLLYSHQSIDKLSINDDEERQSSQEKFEEIATVIRKWKEQLARVCKDRDVLLVTVSRLEMEKEALTNLQVSCSVRHGSVKVAELPENKSGSSNKISEKKNLVELEAFVRSLREQLASITKERDELLVPKVALTQEKESMLAEDSLLTTPKAAMTKSTGHDLHADIFITNMESVPAGVESQNEIRPSNDLMSLNHNVQDFDETLKSLKEQLVNLAGEKDKMLLANQSLMAERDHLLAAVTELESEKDASSKRFRQDLHVEGASPQSNLQQQIGKLNAQQAALIEDKDLLPQERETLRQKRDNLVTQLSALKKEKVSEFVRKGKRRWNSKGPMDEMATILSDKEQHVAILKQQLAELQTKYTKENSCLVKEKAALSQDREDLIVEVSLLKKEKDTFTKKLQMESRRLTDAHEEKHAKILKEFGVLVETSQNHSHERDNLNAQVSQLKEELEYTSRKIERELRAEIVKLNNDFYTMRKENEDIAASELSLKQELDEIVAEVDARDEQHAKLFKENAALSLSIEILEKERDEQLEKLSMANASLSLSVEALKEERESRCAEVLQETASTIQMNKEHKTEVDAVRSELCSVLIDFVTVSRDKEQLAASEVTLSQKVDVLGEKVRAQDETQVMLHKEITTLMQEKGILTLEHDNLVSEVALLKKEQDAVSRKLEKDLGAEFLSLKNELSEKEWTAISQVSLQQQLLQIETEALSQAEQKSELIEHITSLTSSKDSLAQECENLIMDIAVLKADKEALARKLDSEDAIICSLTSELFSANSEKAQAAVAEASFKKQLDKLEAEALTKDHQQLKWNEEITSLTEATESLAQERDNMVRKFALLKTEKEDLGETNEIEVGVEILSLKRKLTAALKEKDQGAMSVISLKQELDELQKKTYAQSEQHSQLINDSTSLVQERDKLITAVQSLQKELEDSIKKVENEIGLEILSIKGELSSVSKEQDRVVVAELSLKQQLNELRAALQAHNEQHMKLKEDNYMLGQQKKTLRQERTALEAEVSLLRNEKEKTASNFKNEKEQTPCSAFPTESELEELRKEVQLLKQQRVDLLLEKETMAIALQEEEQISEHAATLRAELDTLNTKVNLLNQQQDSFVKEKVLLVQENVSLKQRCENLLTEIVDLKAEVERIRVATDSQVEECVASTDIFAKQKIAILETEVGSLKDQQDVLANEKHLIVCENKSLMKDRDELLVIITSLKKQHEEAHARELRSKRCTANSEASLQQKFDELVETMQTSNKAQEHHALEKELMTQAQESLIQERDKLLATVTSLGVEETSPSSIAEHQPDAEEDQSVAVKDDDTISVEASLQHKLDEASLTVVSLTERLAASTAKQEYTKLRMALFSAGKDKDNLSKRLVEVRTISDRLAGEVARLQRDLSETEKKLVRAVAERDNAVHRISELQMLLNNQQQRLHQHLQMNYPMDKIESLEAENKFLRLEKDRLNKCIKDIETIRSNILPQQNPQHLLPMANFRDDRMGLHPPQHNAAHPYLPGPMPGRSRPSHQQWPM